MIAGLSYYSIPSTVTTDPSGPGYETDLEFLHWIPTSKMQLCPWYTPWDKHTSVEALDKTLTRLPQKCV